MFDFPDKFKGNWFLIIEKGHDENLVEKLKEEGYTKCLVAGYCAIEEVGDNLIKEFGKRKVIFSGNCNNLAETVKAILKLAKMTVLDLVPISIDELMMLIKKAQEHGSTALTAL